MENINIDINDLHRAALELKKECEKPVFSQIYQKEVVPGGYLTHALTDESGKIWGINPDEVVTLGSAKIWYWSIVLKFGNLYQIIIKGEWLSSINDEQLQELHRQSQVNLNDSMIIYASSTDLQSVAAKLSEERKRRHISFGDLQDMTGIDKSNIQKIERGGPGMTLDNVGKIAHALNARIFLSI